MAVPTSIPETKNAAAAISTSDPYATPDASRLTSGYRVDADGCVVTTVTPPSTPMGRIHERPLMQTYRDDTYGGALALAMDYYAQQAYLQAIEEYKKVLRLVPSYVSPARLDYSVRLPMALALYRSGYRQEARHTWRTILSHEHSAVLAPEASGLKLLREGRYRQGWAAMELHPPSYNDITYGDSGAAAHLNRGLHEATQGKYDEALRQWHLAEKCSPSFQVPYLLSGYVYGMRGQADRAIEEWIQTLSGYDPSPPDTAGISTSQYDAMVQLIRSAR